MDFKILYRKVVSFVFLVGSFYSCSNNVAENANNVTFNNNIEIRIDTRNLDQLGKATSGENSEIINRLDVLVYDYNGRLFEYLNPQPSDIDGVFVAKMQKDIITGATNKDVFIVANWNETDVEDLKNMTSPDVKKYILTSLQNFDSGIGSFSGANMMSTCRLNYDFSLDRVLKVNLERMYSKLSLKFICDYSGLDTIDTNRPSVSPQKVKVSLEKVENVPTQSPLFPQVTSNNNPMFQNYTFAPLVLTQGDNDITVMNADTLGTNIYDLFSSAPYLKLYPHQTVTNDTTQVNFKLEFYEDETQPPVIELRRVIKIGNVKNNSNYEIRFFINQMDKKTRIVRDLKQILSDDDFCRYEVVSTPHMKK